MGYVNNSYTLLPNKMFLTVSLPLMLRRLDMATEFLFGFSGSCISRVCLIIIRPTV